MEVKEFQKKIVEFNEEFVKKRKFIPSEKLSLIHMFEEVGELAHEYVSEEERINEFSSEKLENALGDIIIHLIDLVNQRGLDIENVVMKIIKEEGYRLGK